MDLDQQQFILPEAVSHEPAPGTEVIEDGNFSYEGYEVVRGEFFSHIYEPSVSFKDCRVQFNTDHSTNTHFSSFSNSPSAFSNFLK